VVRDAYRGRMFGLMGAASALLQLVGTLIAGTLGDALGPIVLLNIQGGAYVMTGALALAILPSLLASTGPALPTSHPAPTAHEPAVATSR
jgi:hypothetical protein